jgi:hypothetical protein
MRIGDGRVFPMLALWFVATPGFAHHSFAMFDNTKELTLQGTVKDYQWQNPHSHITVVVTEGDPSMRGTWEVEAASINILARQGWTRDSYKVGDKITAVGHPLKSGEKGVSLFYVIRADGSRMYQDVSRPPGEQ